MSIIFDQATKTLFIESTPTGDLSPHADSQLSNPNTQPQELDESATKGEYAGLPRDAFDIYTDQNYPEPYEKLPEQSIFEDLQDELDIEKQIAQEQFKQLLEQYGGNLDVDMLLTPGFNFDENPFENVDAIPHFHQQDNGHHLRQGIAVLDENAKEQDYEYGADSDLDPDQYLRNTANEGHINNHQNEFFNPQCGNFDNFEQLQPQQVVNQSINFDVSPEQDFISANQMDEFAENEINLRSQEWSNNRKNVQKKKRGAPFKGEVSNNNEEKFKVQRQQVARRFKKYYEKREFIRTPEAEGQKKKKVFKNNEELEGSQWQKSIADCNYLFAKDLYVHLEPQEQEKLIECQYLLQNSKHYHKIQGDFSLIRDPMYKYSKLVKERLLQNNYMAFLWMYYRLDSMYNERFLEELEIDSQVKETIMVDFDTLATQTLVKGHYALYCYIAQLDRQNRKLNEGMANFQVDGQSERENSVTTNQSFTASELTDSDLQAN